MRDPDSGDEPMEESAQGRGVWQRVPRLLRVGIVVVLVGLGVTFAAGYPLGGLSCMLTGLALLCLVIASVVRLSRGQTRLGHSLGTCVVAVVGVGVTLVAGYPFGMLSYVVMELALLCLAIASVVRLIRGQTRLGHSLGTCVVAVGLLYVVMLGPANFMGLINLRTRARVAMTGGQDQLQAWAVEVLGKPREQMEQDGLSWVVPREQWSEQVRRLKPKARLVRIDPPSKGQGDVVRLGYGGGFFHWYIVVGPPGSVPQRDSIDEVWYRWGDGIYGWFPEN